MWSSLDLLLFEIVTNVPINSHLKSSTSIGNKFPTFSDKSSVGFCISYKPNHTAKSLDIFNIVPSLDKIWPSQILGRTKLKERNN